MLVRDSEATIVGFIGEMLRIFFAMIAMDRKLRAIKQKRVGVTEPSRILLRLLLMLTLECDRVGGVAAQDLLQLC